MLRLRIVFVTNMAFSSIPVIDIGGLRSQDLGDRKAVAAVLRQVCHEAGFFYITNHGVPTDFIAQTLAETKRFFDLPQSVKNEVSSVHSSISRGYDPLKAQTIDVNALPDLKESFYMGIDRGSDDPLVQAGLPNHGTNIWPSNLPGWRSHLEQYFITMTKLARQLACGLALSLDLDEHYFDPLMDTPMSILRLVYYPPHPLQAHPNEFGCGTHTDWGFLTILLQDGTGGLEVCTPGGQWVEAKPIDGTFVINLGDMMARWTNDYYQSTPHRVINRSGQERYSIPFFWDINYHSVVECLPTCQSLENPPKYPPITAGEHIVEMYRKTSVLLK
jgi:isopenicillin N synthase-like dioxygenase